MWRVMVTMTLVAACGGEAKREEAAAKPAPDAASPAPPDAAPAPRFAKVKRPPVSAICQPARRVFGYAATCVETELPELETAAGKVVRLHDPADPVRERMYALIRPSGEIFVGTGGDWSTVLEEILKVLDVPATPPETLARLYLGLHDESSVLRCAPGSDDELPTTGVKVWRTRRCEPPTIVEEGGQRLLTFIQEQFPDPAKLNRDDHELWFTRLEVSDHGLSSHDGEGLIELDPATPRPPSLPALPEMTAPPDWVAAPVKAPADVSEALCAAARAEISGLDGQRCEAYGYPSLTLPTGAIYYLANDAGQRYRYALRKPDGTIVVSFNPRHDALVPILRDHDPAKAPPATLVAAHLLLDGTPAKILCLPGSGDVIPGHECAPPTVERKADGLLVKAILLELPLPRDKGAPNDPAIRAMDGEWGFEGGYLGGGFRLVDLREDADE